MSSGQRVRVGVLYSRVRVEEKLLFEAFEKRGVSLELLDDQKLIFDITDVQNHPYQHFDVIVERCINHSRALYSLKILNDQGVKTVNTALVRRHLRQQADDDQRAGRRRRAPAEGAGGLHAPRARSRRSSDWAIRPC